MHTWHGTEFKAHVPTDIPSAGELQYSTALQEKLYNAALWLGRLDSISKLLPATDYFVYSFVRREAVLSSQIEGLQTSLDELLYYEASEVQGIPIDDLAETSNHVHALKYGFELITSGKRLNNDFFRDLHRILLASGRGSRKQPGRYRSVQNWIGGRTPATARYVPPPPEMVPGFMDALIDYINTENTATPPVIKAGVAHAYFETIHPFADGNGRVGRILIPLILCKEKSLHEPHICFCS